jgi:cytochrome c oxidase subunit 4
MSARETPSRRSIVRALLLYGAVWAALMLLLWATLASSFVDLGAKSAALHLGVAAVQVCLVWFVYMGLFHSSVRLRVAAATGLFWLVFLFSLTFADYLTRDWNGALAPRVETRGSTPATGQ